MSENNGHVIALDELPITITAYEDDKGYALVLTSEDNRISNSEGRLVDNFLVRIARGDVPKIDGIHAVEVNDVISRHVTVADARMDEAGNLFVTGADDGVKHRVTPQ